MANVNAPNGFTPLRHLGGGVVRSEAYQINTSGTTGFNDTIRQGDVVKMNTDGTIELAAAGDTFLGVFDGVQYTASDGSEVFDTQWTASTAVKTGTTIKALVYVDPMISYRVQASTAAQTDVGNNFDLAAGTGSSVTRKSGSYLDQSTGSTISAQFRLLRIIDEPDNAAGAYAKVEVLPVESSYKLAAGV